MTQVPKHIAIIMDGNRRWAKRHGLPTLKGHERGYRAFRKVGEWCLARGVTILTVYAFSTENWNRTPKEVRYLMLLLRRAIEREVPLLMKRGIKLNVLGRITELPKTLQKAISTAHAKTARNTKGVLNIALNYGGRTEIVDAMRAIVQKGLNPDYVTERVVEENLYTKGEPDPDLVIRTSGEMRLSGFLPWQATYAELYFTPTLWPDFSESDLDDALREYAHRKRRFGQ